jgi:sulfatase modifying factor 1
MHAAGRWPGTQPHVVEHHLSPLALRTAFLAREPSGHAGPSLASGVRREPARYKHAMDLAGVGLARRRTPVSLGPVGPPPTTQRSGLLISYHYKPMTMVQFSIRVLVTTSDLRPRALLVVGLPLGAVGCPSDLPKLEPSDGSSEETGGSGAGSTGDTGTGSTISLDTTSGTTAEPSADCGNGQVEDEESCDGTDLEGSSCESLGQAPGSLSCTEDCIFDVSGCVPPGMVLVPGGEFTMGSNATADEQPVRQVTVDAFWIDEMEVTVAEYTTCVLAENCEAPWSGGEYNYGVEGRQNHPINGVTWNQANTYCGLADGGMKRLPTEAEWEKAARGTDSRKYPWGNAPEPSCMHIVMEENGINGCRTMSTGEVGSKPLGVSPYGAQDMAGNAWEWVSDYYHETYDAQETDNPTGPSRGTQRVRRGGGWTYGQDQQWFRAARRDHEFPTFIYSAMGFRCARAIPIVQ